MKKNKVIFTIVILVILTACYVPALPTPAPIDPVPTPSTDDQPFIVVYIGVDGAIYLREENKKGEVATRKLDIPPVVQGVRISRDGKWIAYVRDGELYVYDLAHPNIYSKSRIDFDYLWKIDPTATDRPRITDFYFVTFTDDDNQIRHDLIVNILVTSDTGGMDIFRISVDDEGEYPSRLFAPGVG